MQAELPDSRRPPRPDSLKTARTPTADRHDGGPPVTRSVHTADYGMTKPMGPFSKLINNPRTSQFLALWPPLPRYRRVLIIRDVGIQMLTMRNDCMDSRKTLFMNSEMAGTKRKQLTAYKTTRNPCLGSSNPAATSTTSRHAKLLGSSRPTRGSRSLEFPCHLCCAI